VKQKDYLEKLVTAYPKDERALTALGNYHFAQQEFDQAIADYKKAADVAPSYSPAFNILGYSYRQQGNYADAEQVFKKYVELIPNDPNPYDSYAELLLKMGKFEDSIAQYREALSIDSRFAPSHFGIAADLMYMGKPEDATAELQKMAADARNDGELRTALFGLAVVNADRGKLDQALDNLTQQYAVAEKKNDAAAMAGDLRAKGNVLEQMHRYDDADQQFNKSLQLIEGSSLSQEIKDNAKLLHHYNLAGVAIGKKDYWAPNLMPSNSARALTAPTTLLCGSKLTNWQEESLWRKRITTKQLPNSSRPTSKTHKISIALARHTRQKATPQKLGSSAENG